MSRDSGLDISNRSDIWQTPRQPRCRDACQNSERYDLYNVQSRGFETSRDLKTIINIQTNEGIPVVRDFSQYPWIWKVWILVWNNIECIWFCEEVWTSRLQNIDHYPGWNKLIGYVSAIHFRRKQAIMVGSDAWLSLDRRPVQAFIWY